MSNAALTISVADLDITSCYRILLIVLIGEKDDVMPLNENTESAVAAARYLKEVMQGNVALPGDGAYESGRKVWNSAIDHHPALIAFCETIKDIQMAVRAASLHSIPLSVRSRGHDWTGRSVRADGCVIDLSRMDLVTVDAEKKIATVAAGASAAAVIAAAAPHGLVPVTGWHSVVGMAGLILGGGYGPLIASHGLALDSLVGAEVILADERRVVANASENPDLFWAIRGGGGNFGIIASMQVRLYPLRELLAGTIIFPLSEAKAVLAGYAKMMSASAFDTLSVVIGIFPGPEGHPVLMLAPAWTGDRAQGEEVITSLQQLGTPIYAQFGPMTYGDMIGSFDARVVDGHHHALQTRSVPKLSLEVISAIVGAGSNRTSPLSAIVLQHFRGACTRVPLEATAFGLRQEHVMVEIIAAWEPGATHNGAEHKQWARNLSEALAPLALPGGYPNILGPGDVDQIAHAYGSNLQKLQRVKERLDPSYILSGTLLPT
ncbi:MAG: FAD-binding oxidoreductase [Dongiaceae bacterium]